jgi:hypothetical protein
LKTYGYDTIIRESVIRDMQMNPRSPTWIPLDIQLGEIEDETAILQYGQYELTELFDFVLSDQLPSFWNDDLIKKPDGYYKYGSLEIGWWLKKQITTRSTYSILDLLGDIGGLNEALLTICELILHFMNFKNFTLSTFIVTKLFRYKKSPKIAETNFRSVEDIKFTIKNGQSIEKVGYLEYYLCYRSSKSQKYRLRM